MVRRRAQRATYSIRLDPETRAKLLLLTKAKEISFAEVTGRAVDLLFALHEDKTGPIISNLRTRSHLSALLREIMDAAGE